MRSEVWEGVCNYRYSGFTQRFEFQSVNMHDGCCGAPSGGRIYLQQSEGL